MKTKIVALVSAGAFAILMFAGTASAGEWNQKGDVAAKTQGRSDCLFNGLDEPDENNGGNEGEGPQGYDDPLWSATPAGANSGGVVRVQSGGQLIASGFPFAPPPGIQGTLCNGSTHPINTD
jgi:hypothetical protein